jgi:hypothetical protein
VALDAIERVERRLLALELPAKYGFTIHDLESERMGPLFAEHGVLEQVWGRPEGRAAIVEQYGERFGEWNSATHWITNVHVVEMDDERAVLRAFVIAMLFLKDGDPASPDVLRADYEFRLLWVSDHWEIEYLKINRHGINQIALAESGFAPA